MNATLERPTQNLETDLRQKLQEEIDAFTMPKPYVGQSVVWYPAAARGNKTEVAFVAKASHRNVVLRMASGLPRETVYHIDDPKLKLSPDIRENGAWDLSEGDKRQAASEARMAALESEVAALKATLEELVK